MNIPLHKQKYLFMTVENHNHIKRCTYYKNINRNSFKFYNGERNTKCRHFKPLIFVTQLTLEMSNPFFILAFQTHVYNVLFMQSTVLK